MHSPFWKFVLDNQVPGMIREPWQDKAVQLELPFQTPTIQAPWSEDTNQVLKEEQK